jgi:predicted RND superfamily exporter protein
MGVAVLVSALVLGLIGLGMPAWAASALVGVVLIAGGASAANHFVGAIRQAELSMKETRESVRETIEWVKLQTGT